MIELTSFYPSHHIPVTFSISPLPFLLSLYSLLSFPPFLSFILFILSLSYPHYIAAPAFDEDVDPGWWRGPAAAIAEDEEPVIFPGISPSPVEEPVPVSEVVDNSLEEEIHAHAVLGR